MQPIPLHAWMCVCLVNVTLSIPAKLLVGRTAKKKDAVNIEKVAEQQTHV